MAKWLSPLALSIDGSKAQTGQVVNTTFQKRRPRQPAAGEFVFEMAWVGNTSEDAGRPLRRVSERSIGDSGLKNS
jgi:hypothetical protein